MSWKIIAFVMNEKKLVSNGPYLIGLAHFDSMWNEILAPRKVEDFDHLKED